jgi:hypothetical protein
MCQQCVDAGDMTQEQWDGARAKLYGDRPKPDLKAVLDGLFGQFTQASAKVEETKMDRAVDVLLDIVNRHTGRLEDANLDTQDMAGQAATADTLAMELHYDQTPQALAYALGVIAMRYQNILEQWAALYVDMCKNSGVGGINLDAGGTPEARAALTAAAED